jgi:hypothetical protein
MVKKMEDPPEGQAPAEPLKPKAKPVKAPKKKKEADDFTLPVLVEFFFTFSVIFLILVFLLMTTISWLTGATLLDFILRTSVSMLVQGSLLLLLSRQVSMSVLNDKLAEQEEAQKQASSEETESPENVEKHSMAEAQ